MPVVRSHWPSAVCTVPRVHRCSRPAIDLQRAADLERQHVFNLVRLVVDHLDRLLPDDLRDLQPGHLFGHLLLPCFRVLRLCGPRQRVLLVHSASALSIVAHRLLREDDVSIAGDILVRHRCSVADRRPAQPSVSSPRRFSVRVERIPLSNLVHELSRVSDGLDHRIRHADERYLRDLCLHYSVHSSDEPCHEESTGCDCHKADARPVGYCAITIDTAVDTLGAVLGGELSDAVELSTSRTDGGLFASVHAHRSGVLYGRD